MDSQIEMAHRWAVNKSAGDHDPACKCLGNEEQSHHEVNAKFLEGNFLFEKKIENGNGIHQSGKAGDEAMDPFDVENILVFFQSHIGIDLLEFRCLLILREFVLPGLLTDRRDCSADWIPFCNGKSRACKTDKSSEDNKKRHDEGKDEKPVHHGAVTRGAGVLPASLRHMFGFSGCEVAGIIALACHTCIARGSNVQVTRRSNPAMSIPSV